MTVLRRPVPPLRHISSEALPPSIAALRRSSRSKLRPRDAASLSALSGMPPLWPQVVDTVCSAGVLPRLLKRPLQTALLWTLYEELKPRLTRVLG